MKIPLLRGNGGKGVEAVNNMAMCIQLGVAVQATSCGFVFWKFAGRELHVDAAFQQRISCLKSTTSLPTHCYMQWDNAAVDYSFGLVKPEHGCLLRVATGPRDNDAVRRCDVVLRSKFFVT